VDLTPSCHPPFRDFQGEGRCRVGLALHCTDSAAFHRRHNFLLPLKGRGWEGVKKRFRLTIPGEGWALVAWEGAAGAGER